MFLSCFFFLKNPNDLPVNKLEDTEKHMLKKKKKVWRRRINSCMSQTEEVMADFRYVFSEI